MKIILPEHHAILVEGDPSSAIVLFRGHLEASGVDVDNNPDVIFSDFQSLGIGEARSLIELASGAPFFEEKKRIIITFGDITREAQNALLKLFEDPSPSVEFLIATENADGLLPTLRSRLHIVRHKREGRERGEMKEFLASSLAERMAMIEKMVKDQKDSGSKTEIREFLEGFFYELEKDPKKNVVALRATATALLYIDDKGASVKLLLESVMLAL